MAEIQARLQPPYDVGFPWKLVVGGVEVVISSRTACSLSSDLPVSNHPEQATTRDPFQKSDLEGIKLSKKALRLLTGT